jgi:hypothetical protein
MSVDRIREDVAIVREDLQFNHFALRARGGQDFPAYSLYHAMRQMGSADQARSELVAYIDHFRRERGPVPKYIKDTLTS